MSHEGCECVYARLSSFGFLVCIGQNPKGIKENPEDIVNLCFYPEDALEIIEENGIAYPDPEKRLAKWSMTPDEAREIAEGVIKATEKAEEKGGQMSEDKQIGLWIDMDDGSRTEISKKRCIKSVEEMIDALMDYKKDLEEIGHE